jgi:hypothetical protein
VASDLPPHAIASHARARRFEILVGRELDATLVPRGFVLVRQTMEWIAPTENGPRPASAIYEYETGPAAYVRRYPALAEDVEVEHVSCIDLWLHLDEAGFVHCVLEGNALEELLRRAGRDDEVDRYKVTPAGRVPQLGAIGRGLRIVLDAAAE